CAREVGEKFDFW
nr:immunoglobulin heavy chain junction region [Macaca mulatta]